MTMPRTAAVVASFGTHVLPETMTTEQLNQAVRALEQDLPGNPIGYIRRAAPLSELCECGALHLAVNAPDLEQDCAQSLHRVLATPYGDIVREQFRRESGHSTIRFGWSGIETRVPSFVEVVRRYDAQLSHASKVSDKGIQEIMRALHADMPSVIEMLRQSIALSQSGNGMSLRSHAVSPSPGSKGRMQWQVLIGQVMFAWSTPVRKYLDEYLLREYGMVGGAVNCCIISTMRAGVPSWRQQWFDEQTGQQLTPDC